MGSLTLPASGSVYLDANAIIYSVEKIEPYSSLLRPMWLAAQVGTFEIVSSELSLLEALVGPLQRKDAVLEASFRDLLFNSHEVRLVPISASILESAARWRAATGLKTPDAIHAASSLAVGSSLFLSNDRAFRRVAGLPVAVLSEVVSS